ncbi:MAG: hypothetical protein OEN01_07155 [Candidatus Krumholzibacteria bacterium]|nr:hypothetical protein [Candidatus Krumholzibacteria bacterium]
MRSTLAAALLLLLPWPTLAQNGGGAGVLINADAAVPSIFFSFDKGRYVFRPEYNMTVLFKNRHNDDEVTMSLLGVATLAPMVVVAWMEDAVTLTRVFLGVAALASSQHQLVLTRGGRPTRTGPAPGVSVFVGHRIDGYITAGDDLWAEPVIRGGIEVKWLRQPSDSPITQGWSVVLAAEKPYDALDGAFRDLRVSLGLMQFGF